MSKYKETANQYFDEIRNGVKNFIGFDIRVPPLCSAISKYRSPYLIEKLLKDGADVNTFSCIELLPHMSTPKWYREEWGEFSAIHLAVNLGQHEIVKLLLDYGADLKTKTSRGVGALEFLPHFFRPCQPKEWQVTESDDLEILKLMKINGVDLTSKDRSSHSTVLHRAAIHNCPEITKYLISIGFDVNCVDGYGFTPLHYCEWDSTECARHLLENNANPNAQGHCGNTVYHRTLAYHKYKEKPGNLLHVLHLLHKFHANPNIQNNAGETALHVYFRAMEERVKNDAVDFVYRRVNHIEATDLEFMLRHGADPNIKDEFERTPIHYLVLVLQAKNPDVFDLIWSLLTKLVHCGANLANRDITGTPELHTLMDGFLLYPKLFDAKLWTEILRPKYKVDVNVQDFQNRTVLHLLSAKGEWKLAEIILKHGGSMDILDCDGNTPLDVAILCKQWEYARKLLLSPFSITESRHFRENRVSGSIRTDGCGSVLFQSNNSSNKVTFNVLKKLRRSSSMTLLKSKQRDKKCDIPIGSRVEWTKSKIDAVAKLLAKRRDDFFITSGVIDPTLSDVFAKPVSKIYAKFLTQINKSSLQRLCEENSLAFHTTEECGEEHCLVAQQVFCLVNDLWKKCSEMDPRMKSQFHWTGSSAEGTKMWLPDEFDFLMELVQLRGCCRINDILCSDSQKLFLIRNRDVWSNLCIGNINALSSLKLKDYMSILLWKAALQLNRQKYPNIQFNLCRYSNDSNCFIKDTKVGVNLTVYWNGEIYKNLKINIDVTPAVPVDISERQMYELFEHGYSSPTSTSIHVVPYRGAHVHEGWRASFSLMEVEMMQNLEEKPILIYKCLKLLRDAHDTGFGSVPSYYFKTFLLQILFCDSYTEHRQFIARHDFYQSVLHILRLLKRLAENPWGRRNIRHIFLNDNLCLDTCNMRWCKTVLDHLESS